MDLSKFKKAKILVIGDVMLDSYWYGDAKRISPEAPVPIISIENKEYRLGGAANVALNIAKLGGNVSLIAAVGNDENSLILKKLMNDNKINNKLIEVKGYQTITKLRIVSKNHQLIRLDFEENLPISCLKKLEIECEINIDNIDLIVLSDYSKGVLKNTDKIISLARKKGIKIIVDPKGNNFQKYRNANLIKPNLNEFELIVGKCKNLSDVQEKAKKLRIELNLESLLVTCGDKGMIFIDDMGVDYYFKTEAKSVFDVTGAGDTVCALLALGEAVGMNKIESINLANKAAGIVVSKFGTNYVTRAELENKNTSINKFNKKFKIYTAKELTKLIRKEQLSGKKIIMTNGCFDILHPGHINYLKLARNMGDRLIVALNTDGSVRKLKGDSRPINSLEFRAEMLNALSFVDWITFFDEETPEEIYKLIKPNVLVKGGDYETKNIVGADYIRSIGGDVKVIKYLSEYSTTKIINKIIN
jgi:D-beta-D-heptose 7-phosphate kinase/D-beta-D-heptose 1-phosphate adenosyltransferase